jgi:hypothetical protein
MSNQQHDPDPPTASTAPVGYREAVALLRACSTEHGLVEAINRANAMPMDGEPWSFAEYIHGKELKPRGTKRQGWSAAAAVMAQRTLEGGTLFRIDDSAAER